MSSIEMDIQDPIPINFGILEMERIARWLTLQNHTVLPVEKPLL